MLSALLLSYLIQIPSIQNKLVDRTTSWLSKELNTNVSIGKVNIDFFDQLDISKIYIEDLNQDTLLAAETIKVDIAFFSFLNNKLLVEDITIDDVTFNLNRKKGEETYNLQFLLDYFKTSNNGTKKQKHWLLGLDRLNLSNLRFFSDDKPLGNKLDVRLATGSFVFDQIEQDSIYISAESAILDGLRVNLEKRSRTAAQTTSKEADNTPDSLKKVLQFKVADVQLSNSKFIYNHKEKPYSELDGIDFQHLRVNGIQFKIKQFEFKDGDFTGIVKSLKAKESKSGFEIKNLKGNAFVNNRKIQIYNTELVTPQSRLGDTIVLNYRQYYDFYDFVNKVKLDAKFNNAEVSLKDIIAFAPLLNKQKIISENENQLIRLDGTFKGQVNKLKGKDITIAVNNTFLKGSFRTRDLTLPEQTFLDVKVSEFVSSVDGIQSFFKGMKLPSNFKKLGNLNFTGNFTGFYKDFVADGKMMTDLGRVNSDIQIKLNDGLEQSVYSGSLEVFDFDVAEWASNPIFGDASFKTKIKGKGITENTVNANLDAVVKSFEFKGYNYENVRLDGRFEQKKFDGLLKVAENNLDLIFDGTIDFNDSLPIFDFKANINDLNLYALNLIKQKVQLKGDAAFNFKGNNLDNFTGIGSINKLNVIKDDKSYEVDSVTLESSIESERNKKLVLTSDILTAKIEGDFDIIQLPNSIAKFVETNYPDWANKASIQSFMFVEDTVWTAGRYDLVRRPITPKNQDFAFDVHVKKTNNLTELLVKEVKEISNARLAGTFNSLANVLEINGTIPKIIVKNIKFEDIVLKTNSLRNNATLKLDIGNTSISENFVLPPIDFNGEIANDTLNFGVNVENVANVLKNINVNGILFPTTEYFQASILPSELAIFNNEWDISGDNYVRFGKQYIHTQNVVLNHKNERIALNSKGDKGLFLSLDNIDIQLVNDLINLKKVDLQGTLFSTVEVKDIYKLEDVELKAKIKSLVINDNPYGIVDVLATSDNFNEPIDAVVKLIDGNNDITAKGQYIPPYAAKTEGLINHFDFDVNANHYNLNVAEYFLGHQISNTIGKFDSDLRFYGTPKDPNIGGTIRIYDGAVTIDYLQTTYFLDDVVAKVNNYAFDVTGNTARDNFGNLATARGAIVHKKLKSWGLDLIVESDKFLFLNTEKEDNPDYYGLGIGSGRVHFTGPFNQVNIDAIATTGENTRLTIPLTDENDADEVSFIEFVKPDSVNVEETGTTKIRGVNLDLKLTITPDAETKLVFDEQAGDIIRGKGNGDIRMRITRTGDFSINGNYEIEEGDYLFTYQRMINKPFAVKPGGTIRWSGDPYNADININAFYKGLRAPTYNLIQEYLPQGTNDDIFSAARRNTEINLLMNIKGMLLKPNINFDIEFPGVDSKVKNYVDSKMSLIRSNNSELNRQVFALIVLGNFIPSQDNFQASAPLITGINTLSELISSQLSMYVTDLLSEVVGDGNLISSIDFDVNYRHYEISTDNLDDPISSDQVQLGLRNNFLDDRLSFSIGGNLDVSNSSTGSGQPGENGQYFAGDYMIEYLLTADGQYKIRGYFRHENSSFGIEEKRRRAGLGLNYRKQFDTFAEFIESFKKGIEDRKKKADKNQNKHRNTEPSQLGINNRREQNNN